MKSVFVLSLLTLATSTLAAPAPSTSAAATNDYGYKFWIARKQCGPNVSWACGTYSDSGDCTSMQDAKVVGGDPMTGRGFNITNCLGKTLWLEDPNGPNGVNFHYTVEGSKPASCDKPKLDGKGLVYEDTTLKGCESIPADAGEGCVYIPWYFCHEGN